MATVALRNIRKVYGNGHVAVEHADVTIADGELLVLVGPSGCGKSTLLRLVAGLEEPTSGSILIGERDVTNLEPRDRDIAMVFQSYALYPHMSVAENLGFGLRLRKHPREQIAQRVSEAATMLELSDLLDRYPRQLSGGQRQRVALGRALVRQPQVFLLDEPLSNLDAKLRASMRTEIARLHRALRTTMIYVTHDQVEAMTLGQRIVVLNEGVVQQIDAPMPLYERPANLFVAGFLGNPAMNFFRGRMSNGVLQTGDAVLSVPGATLDPAQDAEREIVVGIRPEDLLIAHGPTRDAPHVLATVDLVELIGNEAFVHARVGSQPIVVRSAPHTVPHVGASIALRYAREKLHFFDAQSGRRL